MEKIKKFMGHGRASQTPQTGQTPTVPEGRFVFSWERKEQSKRLCAIVNETAFNTDTEQI